MKTTETHDNSKALLHIKCCIINITTNLAAKKSHVYGVVESDIFEGGRGLLSNLYSSPPSLIFSTEQVIHGSNSFN